MIQVEDVWKSYEDGAIAVLKGVTLQVAAGQHKVTVSFVRQSEGPYEDLIRPHDWSTASSGNASAGTTLPPRVNHFTVGGPFKVTGLTETPSRKMIFSCPPSKTLGDRACASQIVDRLGMRAYRRPLAEAEREFARIAKKRKGSPVGEDSHRRSSPSVASNRPSIAVSAANKVTVEK